MAECSKFTIITLTLISEIRTVGTRGDYVYRRLIVYRRKPSSRISRTWDCSGKNFAQYLTEKYNIQGVL